MVCELCEWVILAYNNNYPENAYCTELVAVLPPMVKAGLPRGADFICRALVIRLVHLQV